MGQIPPPNALTPKEFNKRILNNPKTLTEINPELIKWHEKSQIRILLSILSLICLISLLTTIISEQ